MVAVSDPRSQLNAWKMKLEAEPQLAYLLPADFSEPVEVFASCETAHNQCVAPDGVETTGD